MWASEYVSSPRHADMNSSEYPQCALERIASDEISAASTGVAGRTVDSLLKTPLALRESRMNPDADVVGDNDNRDGDTQVFEHDRQDRVLL